MFRTGLNKFYALQLCKALSSNKLIAHTTQRHSIQQIPNFILMSFVFHKAYNRPPAVRENPFTTIPTEILFMCTGFKAAS